MNTVQSTSNSTEEQVRATYRYLRILLPIMAGWLLVAIAAVSIYRCELLDSISDYYGGPLRDVFVGVLMATGVCLIAYKGESKLEDYVLNFAGFNAFFVALVPNSFQQNLDDARAAEGVPDTSTLVSRTELLENLRIAGWTLVIVAALFVLLDWLFMKWTRFRWQDQTRAGNVLIVISFVGEILLLGVIVVMLAGSETVGGASIFTVIHFASAALLIVNLSFAAASHAFQTRLRTEAENEALMAPTRRRRATFRVVTALMWLGILVGGALIIRDVNYAVIGTEVFEIVLFIVFWVGATRGAWSRGNLDSSSAASG